MYTRRPLPLLWLFRVCVYALWVTQCGTTFQRFIDEYIWDLPFIYADIDDLLVASETIKQHEKHLQLIFTHLSQYDVIINPTKYQFEVPSLKILAAFNQQTWHPPNS